MITYAGLATTYRAVPPKDSRPQKRSSLVAHWTRVNGKLVYQWVPIQSQEE
ncbi:hypothetical protein SPB21_22770 [Leptothoe sp. ISB3NOV94-8A]